MRCESRTDLTNEIKQLKAKNESKPHSLERTALKVHYELLLMELKAWDHILKLEASRL